MRKLLTILFLVCSLASFGQSFTDIDVKVGVNAWDTRPAELSLPASYADSTNKRYALLFFFHGLGEASGSRNDALLNGTGLARLINAGQIPKAINPIDGKEYEFIVVAPQHSYSSWGADNTPVVFRYMLNYMMQNYRIDSSRVYLTGLSGGAQSCVEAVTWDTTFAKRIAAIYPISLTGLGLNQPRAGDSVKTIGKHYHVASWTVVGSNDTNVGGTNTFNVSDTFNTRYNSLTPSPLGIRTVITGGTHSANTWDSAYSKTWNVNANNGVELNMYEWMLQYRRTDYYTPPVPDTLKIPITTEYVWQDNSQQDRADVLIDDDTTVNYTPAGPTIYNPHEIVFDLWDWNATIDSVKMWMGFTDTTTVSVIAVRKRDEAEISLGTFSGGANQHYTYTSSTDTAKIAKVILRTYGINRQFGSEIKLYGQYTLPTTPAKKVRRPLGWMAGMDGHSYDGMNKAKLDVIKSIGSTLGGYRIWENAYDVTDSAGNWKFEPELGASPRYPTDSIFKQLKAWSPNVYTWKVVSAQFTDQKLSWDVVDNYPNRYFKGDVDSVVDHGSYGEVWINVRTVSQPTETTIPAWYVYKNGSLINKTETAESFSASLVGQRRHQYVAGGLSISVGDTLYFYKSQRSVNPIFWNDNAITRRNTDSAHLRTGNAAFVYASRYGKNTSVPDYPIQSGQRMLKGTNLGNATELFNEANAWWTSFNGFWNGKTIFYHQNMVYDGNKKGFSNTGAKQADSTIEVLMGGMATDKIDQVASMIDEARKVRGYNADGTINVPFDVINIHIYSSPAGQYATSQKGGLGPEAGMLPSVKMFVNLLERKAPHAKLFISEWGWDQNKNSPLHAGIFGSYDREAVGGIWMVRGMLVCNAYGADRMTYYTMAMGRQADTSDATQFANMRLFIQPDDNVDSVIVRSRQGDYMAQFNDCLKNYTYSDSIVTGIDGLHAYKYTYGDTTKLAYWREETYTIVSDTTQFLERTGTVDLAIPAGSYNTRHFMDNGSAVMDKSTSTSTGTVTFSYAAKPVVIEYYTPGTPRRYIFQLKGRLKFKPR
jgi:hypothetical protein